MRGTWLSGMGLVALMSAYLTTAQPAHAAAPGAGTTFEDNPINYVPPATQRRGGFALALNVGYGIGSYRGYPAEVAALGDPDQRVATGPALSTLVGLWLGGALRDWLTVGTGLSLRGAMGEVIGSAPTVLFRVEAFPLFSLGGLYQDLGVGFDGGLGISALVDKDSPRDPLAEGGAMSSLALSVFWEPLRFWHFSAGPELSYMHAFSQTMTVDQATLGFRLALYGVQPKKKKGNGGS